MMWLVSLFMTEPLTFSGWAAVTGMDWVVTVRDENMNYAIIEGFDQIDESENAPST